MSSLIPPTDRIEIYKQALKLSLIAELMTNNAFSINKSHSSSSGISKISSEQ